MKKLILVVSILSVASLCFAQATVTPVFKKYVVNSAGQFGDFADITDTVAFTAPGFLPTFTAADGYVHYSFWSIFTAGTDSFYLFTGSAPNMPVGKIPSASDTLNITWLDSTKVLLTNTKTDIWPVLVGKPSAVLVPRVKHIGATTGAKARRFVIEAR